MFEIGDEVEVTSLEEEDLISTKGLKIGDKGVVLDYRVCEDVQENLYMIHFYNEFERVGIMSFLGNYTDYPLYGSQIKLVEE